MMGLAAASLPWLVGAYVGYTKANEEAQNPKLDIHLEFSGPRNNVGRLLAPVQY